MAKWRKTVLVLTLAFVLTVGFSAYATYCYFDYNSDYHDSDVPEIEIMLSDVTLEEIKAGSKEISYDAVIEFDDENIYHQQIELKGRGNSTWGLEKSPFQIKFSEKTELLGLGKAKKWVLLANYFDASQLRTEVAFYLERMFNEQYALDGRFVELIVDGEDVGLYYLTPKIEIEKSRIDLRDPLGVLMEYDNLHSIQGECTISELGHCLVVKDVVTKDYEKTAINLFMEAYNSLHTAARNKDYRRVQELADVESLAIYYLLTEFSVNPDGYASSMYFYKDGPDDKIHLGPGWDFDYAFSNKKWEWGVGDYYSPLADNALRKRAFGGQYFDEGEEMIKEIAPDGAISRLLYWLMEIPEFEAEVTRIYCERMLGRKGELMQYIFEKATLIKNLAIKNNQKYDLEDFYEAKNYLVDWVSKRYSFFDDKFGGLSELIQR